MRWRKRFAFMSLYVLRMTKTESRNIVSISTCNSIEDFVVKCANKEVRLDRVSSLNYTQYTFNFRALSSVYIHWVKPVFKTTKPDFLTITK